MKSIKGWSVNVIRPVNVILSSHRNWETEALSVLSED